MKIKKDINNITLYLEELEKQEQTKLKVSRKKERKMRPDMDEIETRKINKTDQQTQELIS